MEHEKPSQATTPANAPRGKPPGLFRQALCIVFALLIPGAIASCTGGESGGGMGWTFSDENFYSVFTDFPQDEGMVYKYAGRDLKVLQATWKGNLVEDSDRVVWVETKRRHANNEPLDEGYYLRRGSMEYETVLGTPKRVARYVEVTSKVRKQIDARKPSIARQVAKLQAGRAAGETTILTLPGGVAMEMVWCPPGTFTMGSPAGEDNEKPPHPTTLTKGFWMGKTEVTQAQWKSVMGSNPSSKKGDDRPVENVSWNDCQAFCKDTGLQLPTEAQWEYACRAGSTGPYAGTGNLDEMGWHGGNGGWGAHPVGTKRPNAWGLSDMHGNVWEWCADAYGNYPAGAVVDPQGPPSGLSRVLRGGCWNDHADACTSSARGRTGPSSENFRCGFRLVGTPAE